MTTLYKPVHIVSAEQAEALPAETLWPHVDQFGGEWTALVPIEAEEETIRDGDWIGRTQVRYVTEWEEA